MADVFSKEKRSAIMSAIRSKKNKETELKFIEILRENQIKGWRRNVRLKGNPDFVFPLGKFIVFVDGCFWHGCPHHYRLPKSNKVYWQAKIDKNKRRDRRITRHLRKEGWIVIRIWQHELSDKTKLATRIRTAKLKNRIQ